MEVMEMEGGVSSEGGNGWREVTEGTKGEGVREGSCGEGGEK